MSSILTLEAFAVHPNEPDNKISARLKPGNQFPLINSINRREDRAGGWRRGADRRIHLIRVLLRSDSARMTPTPTVTNTFYIELVQMHCVFRQSSRFSRPTRGVEAAALSPGNCISLHGRSRRIDREMCSATRGDPCLYSLVVLIYFINFQIPRASLSLRNVTCTRAGNTRAHTYTHTYKHVF